MGKLDLGCHWAVLCCMQSSAGIVTVLAACSSLQLAALTPVPALTWCHTEFVLLPPAFCCADSLPC